MPRRKKALARTLFDTQTHTHTGRLAGTHTLTLTHTPCEPRSVITIYC